MIDTHCHLFINDYPDIDDVIKKMAGNIIIVSGCDDGSNREVVDLCKKYNNVYGTLGIHPESVLGEYDLDFVSLHINDDKIIGVGEIGLDYHYDDFNKNLQIDLFCRQIEIAIKSNKPIVIHSRDAALDTYEIIEKYNYGSRCLIHCFSYSLEMAIRFTNLGCLLGIGGLVTFNNASKIKNVVDNISIESLVLETDSPYMTPAPFRGQRNEPFNIIFVANKIASIKGITLGDVLNITSNNCYKIFDF